LEEGPGQREWRGLPYFDVVGRKTHLTYREMRTVLTHPSTIFFLSAAVLILVLFDVHSYQDRMSIFSNIILWFICVLTLTGFYAGFTALCIEASRRFSGFFVYFPIIGLGSMTLNTFLTQKNATFLMGDAFVISQVFEHLPVNLAVGLVFESLFLRFVAPQLIRMPGEDQSSKKSVRRQITIANRNFQIDRLLHISSQDHYVEVVTDSSKDLIRARLSDVAAQIPDDVGIMPHRSHWVARGAVSRMAGNANKKVLVLGSGVEVPIARGRLADVQEWLEQREA